MTSDIASWSAGTAKCTRVVDGATWVPTRTDTTQLESVRRQVYNTYNIYVLMKMIVRTCDIVGRGCMCFVCMRVCVRDCVCVRVCPTLDHRLM